VTSPSSSFRILVLCTGNSARSQIGEALISARGATRVTGRVEATSAGSRPAPRIHPHVVTTLAAHGITWDGRTPKSVDDVAGERFHLAITVCDNAHEACPYFPGAQAHVHWGLPDPADATDDDEFRHAFSLTFDALSARLDALLALPIERMTAAALTYAATSIHRATKLATLTPGWSKGDR